MSGLPGGTGQSARNAPTPPGSAVPKEALPGKPGLSIRSHKMRSVIVSELASRVRNLADGCSGRTWRTRSPASRRSPSPSAAGPAAGSVQSPPALRPSPAVSHPAAHGHAPKPVRPGSVLGSGPARTPLGCRPARTAAVGAFPLPPRTPPRRYALALLRRGLEAAPAPRARLPGAPAYGVLSSGSLAFRAFDPAGVTRVW
jgi:hypothetical protein